MPGWGRGVAQSCCSSSSHPSAVPHLQTHCPAFKTCDRTAVMRVQRRSGFRYARWQRQSGRVLLRSTCLSLAREDRPLQRRFCCSQPVNRGSEIWQKMNKGASIRDRRHNGCEPASLAIFFRPPHLAGRNGFDSAPGIRVRYTIALHGKRSPSAAPASLVAEGRSDQSLRK